MRINQFLILAVCLLSTAACNKSSEGVASDTGGSNTGTGGSLAKFTINGNYLYTVQANFLKVYDIQNASAPVLKSTVNLNNSGVETIFNNGDYLFFGTQNGMLIYDISTPLMPDYVSTYSHVLSCDPVVVSGKYAWVTLSTGSACGRGVNQLELIDISNIYNPQLKQIYTFSKPRGLAVSGNYLYLCDEISGFRVLDISDPMQADIIAMLSQIKAFDVIYKGGMLTLTASDGIYQYDATDPSNLKFVSKIKAGS